MEKKIKLSNIVINYAEIRFDFIAEQKLKEIITHEKDKFGASLFNQPNFKRLILPQSKKTILITPDRKLLVEDVSGKEPNKSDLIKKYLPKALEVLENAASRPSTYGFNYAVIVGKVKNVIPNPALEKLFSKHEILGIGSNILYSVDDNTSKTRFDLRFEPNIRNKKQYIVNLNAHYELKKGGLPPTRTLQKQYKDSWKHLSLVIGRIFS